MRLPILAIPMGDPSGIGPEIIVKALNDKQINMICKPIVIGEPDILEKAKKLSNISKKINPINDVSDNRYKSNMINVIPQNNITLSQLVPGSIQATSGKAAYNYIKTAVEISIHNKCDAIVTPPIHKEALKYAGIPDIGHTEILANLTDTSDPLTVFEVSNLRIFFLSRHVSLRNSCQLVTQERITKYIKRCIKSISELELENNKFAVAGLNPHCSDGGLFGNEEEEEIIPAIKKVQQEGYNVIGPIGADSIFHLAMKNNWSGVLSLYHDQGHIAAKTYDFEKTISLTLGLPFLRTSVDHGTAFDIAWQGKAQAVSMIEAIKKAAHYSLTYKKNHSKTQNFY